MKTKILVKLSGDFDGAKVYCTLPSAHDKIDRGLEKGDTFIFKATFTRSSTDRFFAFGKRPIFIKFMEEKL